MKCYSKRCIFRDTSGGVECESSERCVNFNGTDPQRPRTEIDHPTHYQGKHECIDIMREIFGDDAVRSFCICNAYKYRFRAGRKNGNSAQDDMRKAEWYETYIMEHLANNGTLEWERMADE